LDRLHLFRQLPVYVPDFGAASQEAFGGFTSHAVPFVLGNHRVEGALNRLSLSVGLQDLLRAFDLVPVKAKMLVCDPLSRGSHLKFLGISA